MIATKCEKDGAEMCLTHIKAAGRCTDCENSYSQGGWIVCTKHALEISECRGG